MENGLNYYLLDIEQAQELCEVSLIDSLAVSMLQEWLFSDNFKVTATYEEIERETHLGRRYHNLLKEDQYWKDEEYVSTRSLLNDIYALWYKRKWCYFTTTRNGAPRRSDYSQDLIKKALRLEERPGASREWARSIVGTRYKEIWVKAVILRENIFKQIYSKTGAAYFTGFTKEEIASNLQLPSKFVKEMCRWLERTGDWSVVRCRKEGTTRREMRLTYV